MGHGEPSPDTPRLGLTREKLKRALDVWEHARRSDGSHRWVVQKAIGKGASGALPGAVFKALDTRAKKPVAIKVVEPSTPNDRFTPAQVRQLRREAEAMKLCNHDNVCACLDYTFLTGDDTCTTLQQRTDAGADDCMLFGP